jgi:L-ascorbate metabolism protein UlaG (beta-lactamase superfamily)
MGAIQATGADLVRQIASTNPARGSLALWWFGQAGFALRGAGLTALVDPFLGPHEARLISPAVDPREFSGVNVICCTHEHLDHLDGAAVAGVASASPAALIVVPRPIVPLVTALGIGPERVIGAQPYPEEPPLELGPLRLYGVPARHGVTSPPAKYDFGFDEPGSNGLYRYLGFVFELNGVRVFHAGDTLAYEGMAERIKQLDVDLALLPINGRDFFRESLGIVGNLSYREAAELAAAAEVPLVVPMHYDMFAINRERPGTFVDYLRDTYPFLNTYLFGRYGRFVYSRPEGPR